MVHGRDWPRLVRCSGRDLFTFIAVAASSERIMLVLVVALPLDDRISPAQDALEARVAPLVLPASHDSLWHSPQGPATHKSCEASTSTDRKRARSSSVSWGIVQEYQFTPTLDASKVSLAGPPIGLGPLESQELYTVEAYDSLRNPNPAIARQVSTISPEDRHAAIRLVRRTESIDDELLAQEATKLARLETVREVYAEVLAARRVQRETAVRELARPDAGPALHVPKPAAEYKASAANVQRGGS